MPKTKRKKPTKPPKPAKRKSPESPKRKPVVAGPRTRGAPKPKQKQKPRPRPAKADRPARALKAAAKKAASEIVFVKDRAAVTRDISGETIVVPVRTGAADLNAIFVLNETGSWIWEHLDGRTKAAELAQGLMKEFDISAAQARADVGVFLESLAQEGLIQAIA